MKLNKKFFQRSLALCLTILLFSSSTFGILAQGETANTPKEEVVYVNLDPTGTVEEINVVNIFDIAQKTNIVDYGDYESFRNMTSESPIQHSGDTISIESEPGKLYYEGKLRNTVMPWNVRITYYMNDRTMPVKELAGMSGNFKMHLSITKNDSYQGDFYDNYALQVSFSLDTEKFESIVADKATVANVGKDKQLTYTILPGKGLDADVTAKVTNFELGSISMNGIPLNLDIDVDDAQLLDKINELSGAINEITNGTESARSGSAQLSKSIQSDLVPGVNQLDSGAAQLSNGAILLENGGIELENGINTLEDGSVSLDEGIVALDNGIIQIQNALNELNSNSDDLVNGSAAFKAGLAQLQSALSGVDASTEKLEELTTASHAVQTGIDQIAEGVKTLQGQVSYAAYAQTLTEKGLDPNLLKQKNQETIETLKSQIEALKEQIKTLEEAGIDTTQLTAQVEQLTGLVELLSANVSLMDGTAIYLDTVNTNMTPLVEGVTNLQTQYQQFDSAIQELVTTLTDLIYKLSDLKNGVNTLVSEYEKIDTGINSYTNGVSQIVTGYGQVVDGANQLVEGSNSLRNGMVTLSSGSNVLVQNLNQFTNGAQTLKNGTNSLKSGTSALNSGASQLLNGMNKLSDGTVELRNRTKNMDSEVSDQIDELTKSITGNNYKASSFVSSKNTNINNVQFVIRTSSITVPDTNKVETKQEQPLTFWQKFLKLFGLYHE